MEIIAAILAAVADSGHSLIEAVGSLAVWWWHPSSDDAAKKPARKKG